jgi:nucleoside-diphosphate-sugar epimerase
MKLMKLVKYLPVLPLDDSRNKRYFNYIENLVACIDRIVETRLPGVFISMDKDPVSTTELVKYIAESLDRKILLIRVPLFIRRLMIRLFPEKFEQLFGSCLFDNTITRNRLNYIPLFSTREGIMRTLNRTSGISDE